MKNNKKPSAIESFQKQMSVALDMYYKERVLRDSNIKKIKNKLSTDRNLDCKPL